MVLSSGKTICYDKVMSTQWLTFSQAAEKYGYSREGFRDRLRQLRELGYVADVGHPPSAYAKLRNTGQVVVLWANPKAGLIRADAPEELFDASHGYRAQATPPARKSNRKSRKR
jgi:hypothetical protein